MGWSHPELLLLALPAGLLAWRLREPARAVTALRFAVLLGLVAALAGPHLVRRTPGRDLVIVVDRSRSMPERSAERGREIVRLAEEARGRGDRVAVVGFGAAPEVERLPSETQRFAGFTGDVNADGSDLGAALEAALELVGSGRPGGLLLVSDGESNGRDPVAVARRAFARGIPIDTLAHVRPGTSDLSVERFELPEEVAAGEPFQFTVWVRADARVEAAFEVERAGRPSTPIAAGRRVFERGLTKLVLRDVIADGGVADYSVRLTPSAESALDRTPENDVGRGAVRVRGARAVLVVNDAGTEDLFVRALQAAGIPALARRPETAPLDRVGLTAFRAVVLENVEAGRLGSEALRALADFVTERGGGLLVTGGRASFGIGGYHLSPIDPLLPVSMEMRQEARKQAVALAIAMDRSGSMQAPVGTLTKMDLANMGAAAAIELLSSIDAVAVIAVDSAPHVIQPLTPVEDSGDLVSRVLRIESSGGGIFTHTALVAAAAELERAEQVTRHVILFADAADAEEQEGVPALLAELARMDVTVSVIALGTEADPDAAFLTATAAQGGGEVYFTSDPTELPRLFAQDTLMVARSTFVEETTGVELLPDLFGLGQVPTKSFPALAGYNLTYLRPDAVAGAATTDDYRAPIFAFTHRGIGRTAAFTGQIGGSYGAAVAGWDGFAPFFVTAVRWLVGTEEPEGLFATVRREGQRALVAVEVDPEASDGADGTGGLTLRLQRPGGSVVERVLERVAPDRFEARVDLGEEGIALGTVRLAGDRFLTLAPIALPYSPEFERGTDAHAGRRLLQRIADESGGRPLAVTGDFFREADPGRASRSIARELLALALALFVLEIAVRRLALLQSLGVPRFLRRGWRALRRRAAPAAPAARTAGRAAWASPTRTPRGAAAPRSLGTPAETGAPRAPAGGESMASALERARRSAARKLDR